MLVNDKPQSPHFPKPRFPDNPGRPVLSRRRDLQVQTAARAQRRGRCRASGVWSHPGREDTLPEGSEHRPEAASEEGVTGCPVVLTLRGGPSRVTGCEARQAGRMVGGRRLSGLRQIVRVGMWAQSGSAPDWGSGGRWFESSHPDHFYRVILQVPPPEEPVFVYVVTLGSQRDTPLPAVEFRGYT